MRHYVAFTIALSFLSATTINVPADYETIQTGINQSLEGDTIMVQPGTYHENLMINKEITLTSTADFEAIAESENWHENETINQTIVNGSILANPNKRSCVVVRDGNIQPTIKGFTFEGGVGTNMLILDCSEGDNLYRSELTGGGVLIYDAYPTINYNRFINNGLTPDSERGRKGSKNGGAIAHYEDAEVEFDEDRESAPNSSSNANRTVPGTMDIQNNYFEGNTSGNGQGFYSYGYEGSINVSNSVFENIDCGTNTVNEYVLNSAEGVADYVQDGVTGGCIEENAFYVAMDGNNSNSGTESSPFATIAHALSLVKDVGNPTTIYVAAGTYSPDLTGEIFPINIPNNVHLIGEDSETTILDADADAQNEAAVVIIQEVETVTLKNFTLTNGYTEGHGCRGGGGLLVSSNNLFDITLPPQASTPVIENIILEDNWSHNGGGISFFLVDGPVLSNIEVRNNQSTFHGGGVFIYVSNVEFTGLVVSENRNWGNPTYWNVGNGGGIMSVASGVQITDLTLTNNIGVTMGGGLFHMGSSFNNTAGFPGFTINGGVISGNEGYYGGGMSFFGGADPVLNNVEISDNYGGDAGGGVHMDSSSPTLNNCIIINNGSPQGGGVFAYNDQSYPIIENSIIKDNVCSSEGAGVYYKNASGGVLRNSLIINNDSDAYTGGVSVQGANVHIINSTIAGNTAGTDGGVANWGNGNTTITNSIAWGNTDNGGTSSLNVWDGDISMYYSNTDDGGWDGDQNLSAEPLFIDASIEEYGLQIDSPCIDAGTTELTTYHSIPASNYTGFGDITEYEGSAPDMGAYEMVLAVNPPTNVGYMLQTSSIILMWSAGPASYQYKVEKSLVEDFSADVEEFLVEESSFTDSDIQLAVEYFYRVTSVYGDVYSDPSDVVSLMIVPIPTGLDYAIQNDESVTLTWDSDESATNYQIQRSRDPMFFGPSDLFYSSENNFTDNTLSAGIMHYYRVRSYYGDYLSEASDNVSVIIVPAPVGVVYNTIDEYSVSLSWDEVAVAEVSYVIERATDSLFTTDVEEFTSTENSFVDNSVEAEIEYYYRVSAVCCDGDYASAYSDVVSVMLTVMDVDLTASIPDAYSLQQNYPNPFNPTTQIRYGLKENTYVSINIYDLMGKRIRSLVNTNQDAGYRSIYWNATNDHGQPVSAGMYIYTIQAGDFRKTMKMVLLK